VASPSARGGKTGGERTLVERATQEGVYDLDTAGPYEAIPEPLDEAQWPSARPCSDFPTGIALAVDRRRGWSE